MPLSIFSFKKTILSVSLIALTMLIAYGALIPLFGRLPATAQNQYQENQIKAEKVIFSDKPCTTILIGSSLTNVLEEGYFSKPTCNLGFSGDSALTGIHLLNHRRHQTVSRIIVELNILLKPDQAFLDSIIKFPNMHLKKIFRILRQENQPVTALLRALRTKFPRSSGELTTEQFDKWLLFQTEKNSTIPDEYKSEYQQQALALKEILLTLQRQQNDVTLLWMPIHPQIAASPKLTWSFEEAQKIFPVSDWKWKIPASEGLQTSDGLHLIEPSAKTLATSLESLF